MPYVQRDAKGNVIALFAAQQPGGDEYLSSEHPEVQVFLAKHGDETVVQRALKQSDNELARVTEDLIHLLVDKNLIRFTDLPEPVQNKLLSREQLRAQLGDASSSPLSDDDTL